MPTDKRSDSLDERTLGRGIAIGLPVVTLTAAVSVGLFMGIATAILVLAAGGLLGVVAFLWASLRVLAGDAPISSELEELEASAQGVDALASRKKMLLRALKDLDNEKALGKLAEEDHEQIAATYRGELKELLRKIDDSLAPHRAKAEDVARAYLANVGLGDSLEQDALAQDTKKRLDETVEVPTKSPGTAAPRSRGERRICPKCEASNEQDAKFCKECAEPLTAAAESTKEEHVEY